mmetsp:Transcript_58102/g.101712  ORF Transcript_58102/g.101712 Transcript_58102/m.101712 type:complete len:789 (+) Transcript_58102:62-2428(+)
MGYRVGELAGPYEVLRLLGRGTFGEVLLARDSRKQPQHYVALKTVSCDQLAGDAAERARLSALAEAQLLLRLRHPHIVSCEEVQWDAERRAVWFALELMNGGDAQCLIDGRREAGGPPFEAHFVRRVLASVGSALQYIHDQGVLHRDVKPANLLLTRRSQRVKLADFGVSKLLEATGRARTVVGTPYYLSPEIVSGQAYGPAADAWALGICLYELGALRRPFEAANPLALVRKICEEPPDTLPEGTAADVRCAVMGLLEREPLQRLTLGDVMDVSDAVAALVAKPPEESLQTNPEMLPCSPRQFSGHSSWELSPAPVAVQYSELSPVSAVSMATSDSASVSEAEILASLTGLGAHAAACGHAAPNQPGYDPAAYRISRWQDSDAVVQARGALAADVDDPEELQLALVALEREVPLPESPHAEAFEALTCELRLRISALRADAAAFLQTLLNDQPAAVNCSMQPADTVTTLIMGANSSATSDNVVAALQTALELASSLGVDTGAAEEHAASSRGLLSLRVAWGGTVRFCLMPVSVSFTTLQAEVAKRFGLAPSGEGPPAFVLAWREGTEVFQLRDQVSWEACLQRRGLLVRPGRLELRLEVCSTAALQPWSSGSQGARSAGGPLVPLVLTGTRVGQHGGNNGAGPTSSRPGTPSRGRPPLSRWHERAGRAFIASSHNANPPVWSNAGPVVVGRQAPVHRRYKPGTGVVAEAAPAPSSSGAGNGGWGIRGGCHEPAALQLEGRSAAVLRGLPAAVPTPVRRRGHGSATCVAHRSHGGSSHAAHRRRAVVG